MIRTYIATHAGLHTAQLDPQTGHSRCERLWDGHWHGLVPAETGVIGFRREKYAEDPEPRYSKADCYQYRPAEDDLAAICHPQLRGLDGVHQVVAADGGLYIAETGNNRLLHFEFEAADADLWPWREHLFGGTAFDVNHPNCLLYQAEDLISVVLHNRSYGPSQLAALKRTAEGFEREWMLTFPHDEVHDIFALTEDRLLYLASNAGSLVDFGNGGEIQRELDIGGYTKGLAETSDGNLLVGSSPEAERRDRAETEGELALVDPETFSIRCRFQPEPPNGSPLGNINDLLVSGDD